MLKERHEIDTNYNHLHLKLSQLQTDEHDRKDKVSDWKCFPPLLSYFHLEIFPSFLSIKYFWFAGIATGKCLWPILGFDEIDFRLRLKFPSTKSSKTLSGDSISAINDKGNKENKSQPTAISHDCESLFLLSWHNSRFYVHILVRSFTQTLLDGTGELRTGFVQGARADPPPGRAH